MGAEIAFDIEDQVDKLIEQLRFVVTIDPDAPKGDERLRQEWNRAQSMWQRVDIMVESYLSKGEVFDIGNPRQRKPSIFDKDNPRRKPPPGP